MAFQKLERIIDIPVMYTTEGALAISAGDKPGEIMESPVIKLGGKPVIPGSSMKGALRSTLESMLAQAGERVCVPFAAIPRNIRRDKNRQREYLAKIGRIGPCEDMDHPCPVCSIFGTVGGRAGLMGRAIVLDATTKEGEYELMERSHVAITRDTKSQSEGSLMTIEAVDAGSVFRGAIRIVNPEDWQVGAVVRALQGVAMLGVGGKKTAGYGALEVEIGSLSLTRFEKGAWHEDPLDKEPFLAAFAERFGA
jgi:CRISPR-associated RAMP protein (TIGR02581 family)